MTGTRMTRRGALSAGACLAMMSQRALAALGQAAPVPAPAAGFTIDRLSDGLKSIPGIHQGKGTGRAKWFRFANAPWPANFMIYELPPGASEGVHVHFLDDRNGEGAFDEYYYVISGQGQMSIDGRIVPVVAGDHVHTPLEVAHGIENTHATEDLCVFLTFIARAGSPYPL